MDPIIVIGIALAYNYLLPPTKKYLSDSGIISL
jgi:hypothetical protein